MPESKARAVKRAKELHYPKSSIVHGHRGYYIAPRGVTSARGKHTYAALMDAGRSPAQAAKIAHSVEK